MTSLAYVAIVDKLYDIMKSENAKSIPFKFISLYLLKELVKKGLNNENFLKYLSEKVCNKLAKWCAEGRLTNDGATLFSSTPSQNGRISRKSDEVWSKMFLKLALCCFDAWGNELSPGYPGLSRFKEKFEVLRSARVDFPESRQLYIEGLRYIIGSLKHLDISHCDFTADFSEMPSRVEASSLNISVPRFDNILPGTESTKLDQVYQGQSTTIEDNKKIVNQKPFLVDDSYTRKTPNQRYQVYTEIQEVVSSQEYSDIANQEDDHSDIETSNLF